jgi:ATP-dependent helicase/DNAse subunit B
MTDLRQEELVPQPKHLEAIADLCRIELSYTRLKTFMDCRRKYKIQYLEGIKTEKTPQLVLGSAAHHALEKYVAQGCSTVEELTGLFMERVDRDPILDAADIDYQALGIKMLNDWWEDNREITVEKTYEVEKYFEIKLPNCLLRGYIDRMEVKGDLVEVTDYKTGKSEMKGDKLKKDLQLPIYAMAAREWYPDKQIVCGHYYLRTSHLHTVTFEDKELEKYAKRVDQWAVKIINEKRFEPTWSTFLCRFCQLSPEYCDHPEKRAKSKA